MKEKKSVRIGTGFGTHLGNVSQNAVICISHDKIWHTTNSYRILDTSLSTT